jgi:Flp pilus assembly protein TadB
MEDGPGFRFFAWLAAVIIACGVAGLVLMLIFTRAWYAWGLGGAFLLFAAVLLLFGWVYDRRQARRYQAE